MQTVMEEEEEGGRRRREGGGQCGSFPSFPAAAAAAAAPPSSSRRSLGLCLRPLRLGLFFISAELGASDWSSEQVGSFFLFLLVYTERPLLLRLGLELCGGRGAHGASDPPQTSLHVGGGSSESAATIRSLRTRRPGLLSRSDPRSAAGPRCTSAPLSAARPPPCRPSSSH